jgi:hypothetical protein
MRCQAARKRARGKKTGQVRFRAPARQMTGTFFCRIPIVRTMRGRPSPQFPFDRSGRRATQSPSLTLRSPFCAALRFLWPTPRPASIRVDPHNLSSDFADGGRRSPSASFSAYSAYSAVRPSALSLPPTPLLTSSSSPRPPCPRGEISQAGPLICFLSWCLRAWWFTPPVPIPRPEIYVNRCNLRTFPSGPLFAGFAYFAVCPFLLRSSSLQPPASSLRSAPLCLLP